MKFLYVFLKISEPGRIPAETKKGGEKGPAAVLCQSGAYCSAGIASFLRFPIIIKNNPAVNPSKTV